ncbi:GLPGLI family protein [Flavobacterium sp. F372]|uniref:GLPGLI family protein n=1 Tax=Flavobacterium bernardetii TaxID=2813823 RepID=A0ABR7J0F1_9FLAO|nr:GLPGLI family protein [Flavobacterium bernardetii]MBC5835511.1 GLPGLI family protein [Flavobacterium bernardetii]NHF70875.1 GLPGLI family protein [Flavobacterium bernardetii]
MKKIFLAVLGLSTFIATAQKDFQGMAVYESKTSTADFAKNFEGNKDITPEMKSQIMERMKKMFEKTFVLNFDKSSSIYKEEEKLDAPGQNGGGRMMASLMGGGGTYYKNVKEKQYTVDKEVFGKEFLIKDSLPNLKWVLSEESKKIGDYTCFKATAVKEASKSDFRNYRKKDEKKKEAVKTEEIKKDESAPTEKKDEKKTNFFDEIDLPKEITVTAWYCPEIPVNQGPDEYWGLPGLIMEVNDGKTVIMCSKLVMNVKDKMEIKAPTGGDKVTQKEFDDIMIKKMKEMSEMNGGPGSKGGMQMRMGR